MDNLFPGIEDVKITPPIMTLVFDKECALPKVGDTVSDGKNYRLVVTTVDKDRHSIQIVINNDIPVKELLLQKREEMSALSEELSLIIHKNFSSGMEKLLLWEQLGKENKEKYLDTIRKIVDILENKGFIKYGPHNI